MHTAGSLLGQVRGALVAAFVLADLASLLQLAEPLYALYLHDAVPTASSERLALLTLIVAPASGRVVAVNACSSTSPDAPVAVDLEIDAADRPLLRRLLDTIVRRTGAAALAHADTEPETKP